MKPGDFVEMSVKSGAIFGRVRSVDPRKVVVETLEDGQLEVAPRRIQRVFQTDGPAPSIAQFERERAQLAADVHLETLWEILVEEGGSHGLDELTELALGCSSVAARAALSRALMTDSVYFKERKEGFEPNPKRTVEERQRQKEAIERAQNELHQIVDELTVALGAEPNWPLDRFSALTRDALDAVRDAAVFAQESAHYKRAATILDALDTTFDQTTNNAFLDLFVALGIWDPDINLGLLRYRLDTRFDPALLDSLPREIPDDPKREDRSERFTVAIDDVGTVDVDDAFSLTSDSDGLIVSVYIADPTMLIELGSDLDLAARHRGSTQYLPNARIPMLPPELAEDLLSLLPQRRRPALAFDLRIDPLGNVLSTDLRTVFVVVDEHLSYDEADQRIQNDSGEVGQLLRALRQIAVDYQERRRQSGALFFPRNEVKIKVDAERNVAISPLRLDSPSRQLVSELMIWVGDETARLCADQQIPAVFRGQTVIETEQIAELLREPTAARVNQALRFMPKARLSPTPERHDGLGIDAYLQATSPLRRYPDLLLHYQLKAWLRGEAPPLGAEEMQSIGKQVEQLQEVHGRLEREARRYWTLRYLESRIGSHHNATVIEALPTPNRYKVEIPLLALIDTLHSQSRLELDQPVTVEVTAANARTDQLKLRLRRGLDSSLSEEDRSDIEAGKE
ncbi:MAG: RNB domain-containing ribonuclease [Myxococcales bacterium]|nr:RNB domain-containing ribonuclease [Myxococcales bacterium]